MTIFKMSSRGIYELRSALVISFVQKPVRQRYLFLYIVIISLMSLWLPTITYISASDTISDFLESWMRMTITSCICVSAEVE